MLQEQVHFIILEMNLVCYKFLPLSKWTSLATHMLIKLESAQITEGFRESRGLVWKQMDLTSERYILGA